MHGPIIPANRPGSTGPSPAIALILPMSLNSTTAWLRQTVPPAAAPLARGEQLLPATRSGALLAGASRSNRHPKSECLGHPTAGLSCAPGSRPPLRAHKKTAGTPKEAGG